MPQLTISGCRLKATGPLMGAGMIGMGKNRQFSYPYLYLYPHFTRTRTCVGYPNLCSCLPVGHPEHSEALDNLAVSLSTRYDKQHNLADLYEAMLLQERNLTLCPRGHPRHASALHILAWSFRKCYTVTKTFSDLTQAIKLLKEALAIYPIQQSNYAKTVEGLANVILLCSVRVRAGAGRCTVK